MHTVAPKKCTQFCTTSLLTHLRHQISADLHTTLSTDDGEQCCYSVSSLQFCDMFLRQLLVLFGGAIVSAFLGGNF